MSSRSSASASRRPPRRTIALCGLVTVCVAWALAGWAGVNGPNYDGWSHGFVAFVVVAAVADGIALVAGARLDRSRLALAAGGVLTTVAAGVVTVHWFGDGHAPTAAATALAWLGFCGLTVAAAALALPPLPRRRPPDEPAVTKR